MKSSVFCECFERCVLPLTMDARDSQDTAARSDSERNWTERHEQTKRLTWSDGQPLVMQAAAVRPSLSEVIATRISHTTNSRGPGGGHGYEQVHHKERNWMGRDTAYTKEEKHQTEYKETTVPLRRFWLLTVGYAFSSR
jgi:hypothetical protein